MQNDADIISLGATRPRLRSSKVLSQDTSLIRAISKYLDALANQAVSDVNGEFGPRRLSKKPRNVEPLPIDPRQLSAYRTRIGTMLEYAISTAIDSILRQRYGETYQLTFVTSHQYPDFCLRDRSLETVLRVEMKAVDADSDEQAARFDAPTVWIDNERDMVLFVGWQWADLVGNGGEIIGEYPYIFASLVVPAGDIARERDTRLEITGGRIEGEKVYVFSESQGDYVADPGNYGKLWRIVHASRRAAQDLSESIRQFMAFLHEIDARSPRTRLRGPGSDRE